MYVFLYVDAGGTGRGSEQRAGGVVPQAGGAFAAPAPPTAALRARAPRRARAAAGTAQAPHTQVRAHSLQTARSEASKWRGCGTAQASHTQILAV